MSAACITFDQIESRTATSVALAVYARRVHDGFIALTVGKPLLFLLSHRLDQLRIPLRSGALEGLSEEQLREAAGLLKHLHGCLVKLSEDEGLNSQRVLRGSIRKIRESTEDLDSILENIYLSLDPGFRKAVSSAIDKLNLGVKESATMLR